MTVMTGCAGDGVTVAACAAAIRECAKTAPSVAVVTSDQRCRGAGIVDLRGERRRPDGHRAGLTTWGRGARAPLHSEKNGPTTRAGEPGTLGSPAVTPRG